MPKYAANTNVSSELSRIEIEKTLIRYGTTGFMYASAEDKAMVAFTMNGKQIKFIIPLPPREDFKYTPNKRQLRSETVQRTEWEQACRQRWRVLNIVIKAKIEAIECGISIFENEFMANIVLPGGNTVSEFMIPQIEQAYLTGKVPSLMPMLN